MARWRSPRVVLAACVGLALLLLLADIRGASVPAALRTAVGTVTGPPERALASMMDALADRFGGSADEARRIEELEAEVARIGAAAGAAAADRLAAGAQRELAALAPAQGYSRVAGRVVALATPQDQIRSATISVGSSSGVGVGHVVLASGGMAGIVESVAPHVATVRLLADPGTRVAARVAASQEVGIFRGSGELGQLELLDPLGRMAVGDLVTTLGGQAGGALPGGLPIGRITGIEGSAADLSRRAVVAPAVDPSTLDHVAVLVPEVGR